MPQSIEETSSARLAQRSSKLKSVQCMRGVAAILVVMFHALQIWNINSSVSARIPIVDFGWAGVDIFFVISGFIIVWSSGSKPPGFQAFSMFFLERAYRIYSLWWIFCPLMAAYFLISYGQPSSPAIYTSQGAWGSFFKSMLLLPQENMPVLAVGWTLTFEMSFYFLFSIFLMLPERLRPLGFWVWFSLLIYQWLFTPPESSLAPNWHMTLLNELSLEFLLGVAVAYALRAIVFPRFISVPILTIGVFAFLTSLILGFNIDSEEMNRNRVIFFGIPFSLVLFGAVSLELGESFEPSRIFLLLGDSSYALYLCHYFILLSMARVMTHANAPRLIGSLGAINFIAFGVVLSVIASVLLHNYIERPISKFSPRSYLA
jgi:exopolysaccharide production protein ExoZ